MAALQNHDSKPRTRQWLKETQTTSYSLDCTSDPTCSSLELKLPFWRWLSDRANYLWFTGQKWNSEPWGIPLDTSIDLPQNTFKTLIIILPTLQIPKPTSPCHPTPQVDHVFQILNLPLSGGKDTACSLHPTATTSAAKCQLSISGTSNKNKKRFLKLFETAGLTFQPSGLPCPFQM